MPCSIGISKLKNTPNEAASACLCARVKGNSVADEAVWAVVIALI